MLVLALDTSSPAVSAALVEVGPDGCRLLAESVVVDGKRHGELLAQGVQAVLGGERAGAVVVGTGPGPFTGLRVGLTTAAVLADVWGVPAYGVCSLDGFGAVHEAVLTDARRREVYWARYDGAGVRVDGPEVAAPSVVAERLRGVVERVVGAGAEQYTTVLDGYVVDGSRLHPSMLALVEVAAERVLTGASFEPLTPLYLRRPDAVAPGVAKRVTA